MFVLAACCEWVPLMTVLGLKSHALGKFCNKVVKSLHFVVAREKASRVIRGFLPLFFKV